MANPTKTINSLTGLLVDIIPKRPLLFSDLEWCKEICVCSSFEKSTDICF